MILFRALLIGLFCLSGFSCKNNPEDQKTLPQMRAGQTFQMIETSPVETLDPIQILFFTDWQMASLMYEGLAAYKEHSADIVPWLAEQWEISDNGKTIHVRLRQNIYFQDDPCFSGGKGRRLVAEDVRYSFQRILDHQDACPNGYLLMNKIDTMVVADDSKIIIQLIKPQASFLKILAAPVAYIVPREAVEFYGENFASHPVGTGPFKLARWRPFREILAVKNTRYWRKDANGQPLPHLDGIRIKLESSRDVALAEFSRGDNMLISGETDDQRRLLHELYRPEQYALLEAPFGLITRFFGFSLDKETPLARSAELRSAVALGLDRGSIQSMESDSYTMAQSMVPEELLGDSLAWYPANVEKAIEIARSIADTNQIIPVTIASNIESPEVTCLASALDTLGYQARINIQKADYFRMIGQDRPDLFRVAFMPCIPIPEEYYSFFYSHSGTDINLTGYSNPEFDKLFERCQTELDEEVRKTLFINMEDLIKRDVPILLLSHSEPGLYLYPRYVKGIKIRFYLIDFSETVIEEK